MALLIVRYVHMFSLSVAFVIGYFALCVPGTAAYAQSVDQLIGDLGSPLIVRQEAAIRDLGSRGPDAAAAVPELMAYLYEEQRFVPEIIRALGAIGTPDAGTALMELKIQDLSTDGLISETLRNSFLHQSDTALGVINGFHASLLRFGCDEEASGPDADVCLQRYRAGLKTAREALDVLAADPYRTPVPRLNRQATLPASLRPVVQQYDARLWRLIRDESARGSRSFDLDAAFDDLRSSGVLLTSYGSDVAGHAMGHVRFCLNNRLSEYGERHGAGFNSGCIQEAADRLTLLGSLASNVADPLQRTLIQSAAPSQMAVLIRPLEATGGGISQRVLRSLYRNRLLPSTLARFPSIVLPWVIDDSEAALSSSDVAGWLLRLLDHMDASIEDGVYVLGNLLYSESNSVRRQTLDLLVELSSFPPLHDRIAEFGSRLEEMEHRSARVVSTQLRVLPHRASTSLRGFANSINSASTRGDNEVALNVSDECGNAYERYLCMVPDSTATKEEQTQIDARMRPRLQHGVGFGLYPRFVNTFVDPQYACWMQRYVLQDVFGAFETYSSGGEQSFDIPTFSGYEIPMSDRFSQVAGADPAFVSLRLWTSDESGNVYAPFQMNPRRGTNVGVTGGYQNFRVTITCGGHVHIHQLRNGM